MRFYNGEGEWYKNHNFPEEKFLFEIAGFKIGTGTPFVYRGKTYYAFCVSYVENKAYIEEITINDKEEFCFYEKNIKCPCCGYEDENSFEAGDWDDSYECPQCGAILSVIRRCEITYDTEVIERPKIIQIEEK